MKLKFISEAKVIEAKIIKLKLSRNTHMLGKHTHMFGEIILTVLISFGVYPERWDPPYPHRISELQFLTGTFHFVAYGGCSPRKNPFRKAKVHLPHIRERFPQQKTFRTANVHLAHVRGRFPTPRKNVSKNKKCFRMVLWIGFWGAGLLPKIVPGQRYGSGFWGQVIWIDFFGTGASGC